MLTVETAIGQAFGEGTTESDLVSRLLGRATGVEPSHGESAIVLFTGYGRRLAEKAADLWSKNGPFGGSSVWIFGPDSLAWNDNKEADAEWYGRELERLGVQPADIEANATEKTSNTSGQARTAAQRAWEAGPRNFALVTAAYHQPRAYMTLLKALQDRRLKDIRVYPRPVPPKGNDWGKADSELRWQGSWAVALATDEAPKIFKYQNKDHVASWSTLRDHLHQIEAH